MSTAAGGPGPDERDQPGEQPPVQPGEQPPELLPVQPPELPSAPQVSPTEGAPAPPGWLGRSAPLVGIGVGLLLYLVAYGLSFTSGRDDQGYWAIGFVLLGFLASVVLFIAGLVLTILQRTRGFGAGLLISIAIGVLVGGGVCIALLRTA